MNIKAHEIKNNMNAPINTLQDALAFQLQGLLYTENKLKGAVSHLDPEMSSPGMVKGITNYLKSSAHKLVKLERIFNYLMQEPHTRRNDVVNKILYEEDSMLSFTSSPHLKSLLVVSSLQSINAYKISAYNIAYVFAIELGLEAPANLLQQILEWELDAKKNLSKIAITEFNKMNEVVC